jgi:uncharacterized protein YdeI (YjbR/CyaY-like superfamily)
MGKVPRAQRPMRPLVRATTRAQWRRWLAANHGTRREAWLVLHRNDTGRKSLPYDHAVEEALCFGWIDSVVRPLGNGTRAQRYTPRRKGSNVSELNRARVRRLVRERRMTKAGLEALPGVDEWLDPPPLKVPKDIERRIRSNRDAWAHWRQFPDAYKRIRIGFIEVARAQPDVFENRLVYLIKKTARGERYGMVQE